MAEVHIKGLPKRTSQAHNFLLSLISEAQKKENIIQGQRKGRPRGFFSRHEVKENNRGTRFGSVEFLIENKKMLLSEIQGAFAEIEAAEARGEYRSIADVPKKEKKPKKEEVSKTEAPKKD